MEAIVSVRGTVIKERTTAKEEGGRVRRELDWGYKICKRFFEIGRQNDRSDYLHSFAAHGRG
jgi:hypothetical protein